MDATQVLGALSGALADVVEGASPSVVRVEGRRGGAASGVLWQPGVVVTAAHAVERLEGCSVALHDGTTHEATLVGQDPGTDLAVLRIKAPDGAVARKAASALRVGQLVVGLGRPGKTVRARLGMLSAVGAEWNTPSGGRVEQYLEADHGPARGFSGGPLVSTSGDVLGINTSGLLRHTMVTLPVATVDRVVTELLAHGRMRTAYLGIAMQPVRLRQQPAAIKDHDLGLLVTHVEPQSPAERAGLLQGDILVSLGADGVQTLEELHGMLTGDMVGRTVNARILRGGEVKDLPVILAAKP